MDLTLRFRAEEKPELAPWRRMSRYVFQQVRAHPDILPFESCRMRGRVMVHAHELAIWLACEPLTDSGGNWHVEYKIHRPNWFLPVCRRTGDQLTEELVSGLLSRWVEWRVTSAS